MQMQRLYDLFYIYYLFMATIIVLTMLLLRGGRGKVRENRIFISVMNVSGPLI